MGHVAQTTPLLGMNCASQPTLDMNYPLTKLDDSATDNNHYTKLEVCSSTGYEDMKGDRKSTNCCGLGRLGVTQGRWQCHHSTERIGLPIQLYFVLFSRYSELYV